MAETQSTATTTTEATAPTGDIKVFIDAFNKDFDVEIKKLVDAQQNYKNVYADAIKISTPKQGPWPNDPKVVTIGDLFKYTFPDIETDNVITPDNRGLVEDPKKREDYFGWTKDLKDSKDEKISKMYETIDRGIKSNSKLLDYQNLKKPGITNPSLWSPGQYYFDVFMSRMLSESGPLKYPDDRNGGSSGLGTSFDKESFYSKHGGSASVANFDPTGEVEYSKRDAGEALDYSNFHDILSSGYQYTSIRDQIVNSTGIDIGGFSESFKYYPASGIPTPPSSFPSLRVQYKSGILSQFLPGKREDWLKNLNFNPYRGSITDSVGKDVDEKVALDDNTDKSLLNFNGNYEHILLYKAFVQAGDNYKSVVLPLRNSEPTPVDEVATKPIVNLPEAIGYTFNVEKKDSFIIVGGSMSGMEFTIVPNDGTTYITNEAPISKVDDEDMLGDEYLESDYQGPEESLLELAAQIKISENLQAELEPGTTGSTFTVNDTNISDGKYVGAVWKSFDIESAINKIKSTSFKPSDKFRESLKQVLYYIKNDPDIKDIREGAYILGTAYAESGYSLQRWEADYACSGQGVPYGPGGPCSSATSYYRSTKGGKRNYYELGTDSKGQCFFGRGLIQLTGKGNYEKYGNLIGVNLLGNGDLAMAPQNSYKVASTYMRGRTFKHVLNNDLTKARKSVNGGTKGIAEVNGAYSAWLNVLKSLSTTVA
jgi:hypothetical protein